MSNLPILPAIGDELKKNEKEVTLTVLACTKCDEQVTREYQEGDIVFHEPDGEICKSCSSQMIIKQIFVEIVKKK